MLEKRKRYVKFIILTILCIVLAGVSVLEGILYLQTKKDYRNLQAQNNKLEQTCQEKRYTAYKNATGSRGAETADTDFADAECEGGRFFII